MPNTPAAKLATRSRGALPDARYATTRIVTGLIESARPSHTTMTSAVSTAPNHEGVMRPCGLGHFPATGACSAEQVHQEGVHAERGFSEVVAVAAPGGRRTRNRGGRAGGRS